VDGRGFHCLELDEALLSDDLPSCELEATVIAMENRLDCDALARDLKALIDENWDWQVCRVSDTDFAMVFPTQASLNLCKNLCRNAGGDYSADQQALCVVCGSCPVLGCIHVFG
jgi:hypothetical protein